MARIGFLAFGLAALAGTGSAQVQSPAPRPPLDLSTREVAERCEQSAGSEIVVCGEWGRSRYRIDETTIETKRRNELARNPPKPPERYAEDDPCKRGPNGCPGEGGVDFIGPALKVVAAVVKAVQGEDWREPFRTAPDEYQLHQQVRAEADPETERPE